MDPGSIYLNINKTNGTVLALMIWNSISNILKTKTMGNLLYLIAVILIIVWIFGAFVSPMGGNLIHILLVIAIVAILLRVIRGGTI